MKEESKALIPALFMVVLLCSLMVAKGQLDFDNLRLGTGTVIRSEAAGVQLQDAVDAKTTNDWVRNNAWQASNAILQGYAPTTAQWQSSNATLQAQVGLGGGVSSNDVVILARMIASGSGGGQNTNVGAFAARPLNVELYDPGSLCVLMTNNNTWSLTTGTYIYEYWSCVYAASQQISKLRDITAGIDVPDSQGAPTQIDTVASQMVGYGMGVLTFTGTTNVFQLQQACAATNSSGWGNGTGWGISNCFAKIKFIKID